MKFMIESLLLNMQIRSRQSRIDQLNDRMLADIGLSRAELTTKVANSYRGR